MGPGRGGSCWHPGRGLVVGAGAEQALRERSHFAASSADEPAPFLVSRRGPRLGLRRALPGERARAFRGAPFGIPRALPGAAVPAPRGEQTLRPPWVFRGPRDSGACAGVSTFRRSPRSGPHAFGGKRHRVRAAGEACAAWEGRAAGPSGRGRGRGEARCPRRPAPARAALPARPLPGVSSCLWRKSTNK